MLTLNEIGQIISQIEYKDWQFVIGTENSFETQDLYLQIQFYAPDSATKIFDACLQIPDKNLFNDESLLENKLQTCRKWRLSPHMTETEIVRTAWKAVLAAEEHEAGEAFKYMGYSPFNPHISIENLSRASSLPLDKREE